MTTSDTLRRFLEGQFQAWTLPDTEQTHARPRPVIAITREPGCGAEHIAQALAQELGLALYDGEMIEEITKDAHVSGGGGSRRCVLPTLMMSQITIW